jgi:hypothetical protein
LSKSTPKPKDKTYLDEIDELKKALAEAKKAPPSIAPQTTGLEIGSPVYAALQLQVDTMQAKINAQAQATELQAEQMRMVQLQAAHQKALGEQPTGLEIGSPTYAALQLQIDTMQAKINAQAQATELQAKLTRAVQLNAAAQMRTSAENKLQLGKRSAPLREPEDEQTPHLLSPDDSNLESLSSQPRRTLSESTPKPKDKTYLDEIDSLKKALALAEAKKAPPSIAPQTTGLEIGSPVYAALQLQIDTMQAKMNAQAQATELQAEQTKAVQLQAAYQKALGELSAPPRASGNDQTPQGQLAHMPPQAPSTYSNSTDPTATMAFIAQSNAQSQNYITFCLSQKRN